MEKTEMVQAYRVEFAEILPAVERWHAMAIEHSRIAIWCAACCGQVLIERKKEIGHGGWMKFLKVLPFSVDTAERYARLAEEWKTRTGQIPHTVRNLEPALLAGGSRAVLELTDDQYTEIAEQTERTVGETTLRQLYFDWGICKPPYRPGGNMRKGDKGLPPPPTTEEIRQTYADAWARMVTELAQEAHRTRSYIHLTDGELGVHKSELRRVADELDSEIKRRAKKGEM
jgi:hypothetical protein